MTEYEIINRLFTVFQNMPVAATDLLGDELYRAVHEYLYEEDDEEYDEFDSEIEIED